MGPGSRLPARPSPDGSPCVVCRFCQWAVCAGAIPRRFGPPYQAPCGQDVAGSEAFRRAGSPGIERVGVRLVRPPSKDGSANGTATRPAPNRTRITAAIHPSNQEVSALAVGYGYRNTCRDLLILTGRGTSKSGWSAGDAFGSRRLLGDGRGSGETQRGESPGTLRTRREPGTWSRRLRRSPGHPAGQPGPARGPRLGVMPRAGPGVTSPRAGRSRSAARGAWGRGGPGLSPARGAGRRPCPPGRPRRRTRAPWR